MKNSVSPHSVACWILGLMAMLSAQHLQGNPSHLSRPLKARAAEVHVNRIASCQTTSANKVRGQVSASPVIFFSGDGSISSNKPVTSSIASPPVPDEPSKPARFRKMVSQHSGQRYEVNTNSLQEGLTKVSAMYRELARNN